MQKSDGVITVIIPTYRRAALIPRAIASIQAQTYPHFRICVYDDGSPDNTQQVISEIARTDSRVEYYRHPTNIGWLKGYSFGMSRVGTEFFVLLGDDDLLLPDFFATALKGFQQYPEAMFSATATLYMDDKGLIFGAPVLSWNPGFYPPPEGLRAIVSSGHPGWPSIVFRRQVLDEVAALDPQAGAATDVDFTMRIAGRFPIVVSTEPGSVMLRHSSSVSSSMRIDLTWPCWLQLINNLKAEKHLSEDVCKYAEKTLHQEIKRRLLILNGFGSVVAGNWQDAHKSADVLKEHYGERRQAVFLHTVATVCKSLPAMRSLASFVASMRWKMNSRTLQRKYGSLIEPAEKRIRTLIESPNPEGEHIRQSDIGTPLPTRSKIL